MEFGLFIRDDIMLANSRGFTLLELLVALSIVAIVLLLGIPSLKETLISSRVDNHLYQLNQDVLLSRNHAIQYNYPVVLCPTDNQGNCTPLWHSGYTVFLDKNNNAQFDEGIDQAVRIRGAISTNDLFTFSGGRYLRFGENGHLKGLAGTFRYCPQVTESEYYSRALIISLGGRPRISQDIDNDGKDELNSHSSHINCG